MKDDTTVVTVLASAAKAAPAESRVLFTVLEQDRKPWHYSMSDGEVVIGRGSRADLQIDDGAISRLHARLERTAAGTLRVTDLGSTNGTYINGVPVEVAMLCEGDNLSIGTKVTLSVRYESEEVARRSYEDALRNFERILGEQTEKYGRVHRNVASTLEMIGSIHLARGSFQPGIEALESALSILSELPNTEPVEVSRVLASLGEAYVSAGDGRSGQASMERALQQLGVDPAREAERGRLRFALARTVAANDPAYARQLASQARKDLEGAGLHAARREVEVWMRLAG